MQITEEHRLLQESLLQLIEEEINPHVDEWEEAQAFPAHEVFKKLGDAGFLGITRSPEYGGMGLDWSYSMVMAEELGHIRCGGVPMAIGVQTDMCTPALDRFGSDELKREFLAPSIAGDLVGCIGVSESGAGSDVASIKTTARRDGDDYVIRGEKMWITNGWQADWMCCLVNTGEGSPHRNKSLIIIPLDAHGVERSRKLEKLGMWSSDTAQLFFDDVRVPRRHLIGEEGCRLQLPDDAVPGRAPVGRRQRRHRPRRRARATDRLHPRAPGLRPLDPRQPGRATSASPS